VDYLVKQHGFDRARFQAVGNGPNKPIGDNKTEAGRELNRRTDFQIIPNN
jgi:outer membrane protein OmpA-like peptidoglycan-associated protein